jgi:hypothetical protein
MAQPVWVTPAGSLGTIPEGVFYSTPLVAVSDDPVYYRVIAGTIPPGIQINETGILSGSPQTGTPQTVTVQGVPLDVTKDTTSQFVVRAYTVNTIGGISIPNTLADRTFSITVAGATLVNWVTPAGCIATYNDGTQVYDLQVEYTTLDPTSINVVTLIEGELPPGLDISTDGVISGYITPNFKAQVTQHTYTFTLRVTNGTSTDVRTFNILVFARVTMTADNAYPGPRNYLYLSADQTFPTADETPVQTPIITTIPGSIGSTRSDNFYAFQFTGYDPYFNAFEFIATTDLPPGLTLDPSTGWLYGYIPYGGVVSADYSFSICAAEVNNYVTSITGLTSNGTTVTVTFDEQSIPPFPVGDTCVIANVFPVGYNGSYTVDACTTTSLTYSNTTTAAYESGGVIASNFSPPYNFSLTITGPVNTDVVWLTPADPVERAKDPSSLGLIDNGSTSTFYVEAVNVSGIPLQYQLLSGSASRLPQGLQLLPSGHIAGRVSFDTFALDGGTTTFDVGLNTVRQPTTFDMVAVFTVNAYSVDGLVSVNKTFSITVVRRYQEPYDNLYIQAMPPQNDRDLLNSLLQNPTIFPPSLIYRNDDPNFGVARNVVYNHAYGLTAATYDDYVYSLNLNHYWKNLILGEIKTAQARDDAGNILYEVIYSEVVDNLVNNSGDSVSKEVALPFPIDANTANEIDVVYPNSLQNMRDQVIDVVGQVSNVLPRWMLSRQADGSILGFTRAWVIAYTNPGQSGQIAYNIQTQFGTQLNLVDFEADRYELDNFLTKNWNREAQHWGYAGDPVTPYPPSLTTFDYSIERATWINDALELTTWEDDYHTLATWTYGTPPGTTFDGNSLLFTAPVDMYSNNNTTEYDKYLLFPKRTVTQSLPQFNQIIWVNDYSEVLTWFDDADQLLIFTGTNTG